MISCQMEFEVLMDSQHLGARRTRFVTIDVLNKSLHSSRTAGGITTINLQLENFTISNIIRSKNDAIVQFSLIEWGVRQFARRAKHRSFRFTAKDKFEFQEFASVLLETVPKVSQEP